MRIVQPKNITNSMLTSSVAITETAWTAGTYNAGDKRYVITAGYEYDYFEALTTTTDAPVAGSLADPQTWTRLGKINRWSMFDKRQGTQTVDNNEINITLAITGIIDSLVLLNIEASKVDITATDAVEGVVYDKTISLINNEDVIDWYTYFFSEIQTLTEVVKLDIPPFSNLSLNVRLYNDVAGSNVAFGELIVGTQKFIGFTQLATSIGINDFSRKEYNEALDYFEIEQRSYIKRATFDIQLNTADITRVQRLLASVRATPVVYIGEEVIGALVLYGFYRNFDINFSSPVLSSCSLEVEGL